MEESKRITWRRRTQRYDSIKCYNVEARKEK
jgi:hypothetical protein